MSVSIYLPSEPCLCIYKHNKNKTFLLVLVLDEIFTFYFPCFPLETFSYHHNNVNNTIRSQCLCYILRVRTHKYITTKRKRNFKKIYYSPSQTSCGTAWCSTTTSSFSSFDFFRTFEKLSNYGCNFFFRSGRHFLFLFSFCFGFVDLCAGIS